MKGWVGNNILLREIHRTSTFKNIYPFGFFMGAFKKELEKEFSAIGKGKPKVLKVSGEQKGKTSIRIDSKRTAMPTGKRMSKYGKIYYEYRKNRTDNPMTKV